MEQVATFKAYPHIGEKVLGYLTNQNDLQNSFPVCKSWNEILKNPLFWLNKLKRLNQPDDMHERMNFALKLKDSYLEYTKLASNLQKEYFHIKNRRYGCNTCKEWFTTPTLLINHQMTHLFERTSRCDTCSACFRTSGHLQKHQMCTGHNVYIIPRPFYCANCKIDFRIHGHFAKHLKSKIHILKLENIGKLPIGMYAKMEELGTDFNAIDTSSYDNSLESLKSLAAAM